VSCEQTIVRRLSEAQVCNPDLNPFVEPCAGTRVVPRSRAHAAPDSPGVSPVITSDDFVIPAPPVSDEPLPKRFVEAMRRVQSLSQRDIDELRATSTTTASQFVDNCLCAVRYAWMRQLCHVHALPRRPHSSTQLGRSVARQGVQEDAHTKLGRRC
jgi:hypothetical protein